MAIGPIWGSIPAGSCDLTACPLGGGAPQLEHAYFVVLTEVSKDNLEVAERLDGFGAYGQRHGNRVHHHLAPQGHTGAQSASSIGNRSSDQRRSGLGIAFGQVAAQLAGRDGCAVHGFDFHPHTGLDHRQILGKDVEDDRRLGRIGDDIERAVAGHIARVATSFGDHTADGGIDRIDLQALTRLDARQQLPPLDIVAHGLGHSDDAPRKLTTDFRTGRWIECDGAEQFARLADRRRTRGHYLNAASLGRLGRNMRAAFGTGVFPDVALAVFDRDHLDVEAVGFLDHTLSGNELAFGLEGETVHRAPQSPERHGQLHGPRIDRLAATRGIDPELRLLPGFEHRDLNGKIAILEEAPAIWAFLGFGPLLAMFRGCRIGTTGGKREGESKCLDSGGKADDFHCTSSPAATSKRPVSRSIWDRMSR